MPRTSLLRPLSLSLLTLLVLAGGCRDENEGSPYRPGGPYAERLDAPGRRMTIDGPDGRPAVKIRASGDRYKVYDAQMRRSGEVRWVDAGDAGDDAVLIEIRESMGEPWRAITTEDRGAIAELEGRFRLERVTEGWAVFDPKANLLGYVDRQEGEGAPGAATWTLRDEFSSPPRLVARGETLAAPKGAARLRTHAAELEGSFLVAMGFDELDALSKVALGAWLRHASPPVAEASTATPVIESAPLVGPPAPGGDAGVNPDGR